MRAHQLILHLAWFFLPPALIGTAYVYFYPVLQNCRFPDARAAESACHFDGARKPAVAAEIAPFRLLAFGDPQLEGDTSLPDANTVAFPSLQRVWDGERSGLRSAAVQFATEDVPKLLQGYRKRLDLWGNDRYLAHVYRSVSWWTQPTHTVVLGDLLGSQWIGDEEFGKRSDRFWNTVFKGTEKVPREITDESGRVEMLGGDESWRKRVVAVAGNHDIGYAGDIDEHRIARFEDTFGSVNWEITFRLNDSTANDLTSAFSTLSTPSSPELRLVVLNSMNLDGPALHPELQRRSLDFLNTELHGQKDQKGRATVVLTHIPLHKEAGICVDAPFFSYHPSYEGGGIKEQNHLSERTSDSILTGLVSDDPRESTAIILNGHDHAGCDVYHYRDENPAEEVEHPWLAKPYPHRSTFVPSPSLEGKIREITVRSMMGSYGGNAGLLSAWFDHEAGTWEFAYADCPFSVQHIWWAVHVLDLVELGLWILGVELLVWEEMGAERRAEERDKLKKA